jgi:hypothetical protein
MVVPKTGIHLRASARDGLDFTFFEAAVEKAKGYPTIQKIPGIREVDFGLKVRGLAFPELGPGDFCGGSHGVLRSGGWEGRGARGALGCPKTSKNNIVLLAIRTIQAFWGFSNILLPSQKRQFSLVQV